MVLVLLYLWQFGFVGKGYFFFNGTAGTGDRCFCARREVDGEPVVFLFKVSGGLDTRARSFIMDDPDTTVLTLFETGVSSFPVLKTKT